jgi:hypothetical protein
MPKIRFFIIEHQLYKYYQSCYNLKVDSNKKFIIMVL